MVSIVCVLNEPITVWGISHFLSKDDSSDRTLAIYIVSFIYGGSLHEQTL